MAGIGGTAASDRREAHETTAADETQDKEGTTTTTAAATAAAVAAGAAAGAGAADLEELVGGDEDIAFEQELKRDPYQLKVWLAYLKSREKAKPAIRV
ncbi:hypothetical protein ACSSS7_005968 [Eimeria intestinalis]